MEKQQISLKGLSKASDLAHALIRSRKKCFLVCHLCLRLLAWGVIESFDALLIVRMTPRMTSFCRCPYHHLAMRLSVSGMNVVSKCVK